MSNTRFQIFCVQIVLIISFFGTGFLSKFGYEMGDLAKSNYTKIFPSIYFLALVILFYNSNFISLIFSKNSLFFYLLSILAIIFYLYIYELTSAISFILNTLIIPFLFFAYLKMNKLVVQRSIPLFAVKLILINSVIAIFERLYNFNLFPIKQTFGEQFRATALLGHPLNNALITLAFILFVLVIDMMHIAKIIYLGILFLAMFCFGARGSLLAGFIGVIVFYIVPIFFSKNNYFSRINKLTTISIIIFFVGCFSYIFLFTPFGERLRETIKDDSGSSQVRLDTLNLIDFNNLSNFYWPISAQNTNSLTDKAGVDIIENFIIIWIFKFGLIFTIILIYFLLRFLYSNSIIKNKFYTFLIFFIFFGAAATNNSLGSSTNALLFFVVLFCTNNNRYKILF